MINGVPKTYRAQTLASKPSRRHSENGSSSVGKGIMAVRSWAHLGEEKGREGRGKGRSGQRGEGRGGVVRGEGEGEEWSEGRGKGRGKGRSGWRGGNMKALKWSSEC